jgi:hypothetical protein
MSSKPLKIGPFLFHAADAANPWVQSRAWVISKQSAKPSELNGWELTLKPPSKAQGKCLPIFDLKRWFLFGDDSNRYLQLGSDDGVTNARKINREDAMAEYLSSVISSLPDHKDQKLNLLMPSIDDDAIRQRYLNVLREVAPEARIYPEPEMVIEYFRLIKRSLQLDQKRNNVVLVVDIGASTADITVVFSNKNDHIYTGETSNKRKGSLRAIQGTFSEIAGQWVNEQLLKLLHINLEEENQEDQLIILGQVEHAKIAVSLNGQKQNIKFKNIEEVELETHHLVEVAGQMVEELKPVLMKVASRLWEQQTDTDKAKKGSREVRLTRSIEGAESALGFVDHLILAGGSSRLPGFKEKIIKLFGPVMPRVLEIGQDFPVAAAVGALAHTLNQRYKPSKLHVGGVQDDEAFQKLSGALETDVLFGWKINGGKEKKEVILERGDPIVYGGGDSKSEIKLTVNTSHKLSARLVPDEKLKRQGRGFNELSVKQKNPVVSVQVNSDRRARIISDALGGTDSVYIDLVDLETTANDSTTAINEEIPEYWLAVEEADEYIIDFGMSKTVVVSSCGGNINPKDVIATEMTMFDGSNPDDTSNSEADQIQTLVDITTMNTNTSLHEWKLESFSNDLRSIHNHLLEHGFNISIANISSALIASAVRPIVLLAGPPGSGKSMLAHLISKIIGVRDGHNYHHVPVQAHWNNDQALFGEEDNTHNGFLKPLFKEGDYHMVILDEFNLTRPEYYLSRVFSALDHDHRKIGDQTLAPCNFFATLNVDDTSRPPSPKVVDRCFLLELEAPNIRNFIHTPWKPFPSDFKALGQPLSNLKALSLDGDIWKKVVEIVSTIEVAVNKNNLRQDLIPSHRAIQDVHRFLSLHSAMGLHEAEILSTDEAIDRAVMGRILIKFSGAVEQVMPVVDAVSSILKPEFKRCKSRIELFKLQAKMGFISPWQ